MKDYLYAGLSILIAVIFYSTLQKIFFPLTILVNIFSIVVIFYAVEKGEVFGAFTGMACGLIQDSFSLGVFGVAGIAKTLLGYFVGFISKKVNVVPFSRNISLNFLLLTFELIVWAFLYSLVFNEKIYTAKGLMFLQPLCTALVASLIITLVRNIGKRDRYRIDEK